MTTSRFQCQIGTTDPTCPLGLEIWLDDLRIYNCDHVDGTSVFEHDIQDDDCEHQLRFVVKNKLAEHTKIDQQGRIVKDACLTITHIQFEGIDFDQMWVDHARYRHNFNGHGPWQDDVFFETLGCNGTVTFEFSTPIYLWLLEHM